MIANPLIGVLFHWLGGLASGSFYVPYQGVRKWSWETYWLVGGVFSWILCPTLFALWLTEDLWGVLQQQSVRTLGWTYFFGALWGLGGLTFGLTMRYLGMSLGMGIALGYCAAFGTLLPPMMKVLVPSVPVAENIVQIATSYSGGIILVGVAICLVGICLSAWAGLTKEREMPEAEKRKSVAEFSFKKGLMVATFSGIMSACFAFALTAGEPIGATSQAAGTVVYWSGLPKLVVVLSGGFTTNLAWCVFLHIRNRTAYQYLAAEVRPEHAGLVAAGEHRGHDQDGPPTNEDTNVPRTTNYLFSALAGITWYFQFFFYTIGETHMGEYGFASWTLHMASIIIFSTLWGWVFREWRGSSRKAHALLAAGIIILIASTIVVGYGTKLKAQGTPAATRSH